MQTVWGADDAMAGENSYKIFATRCVTAWKAILWRHWITLKDSELVSYVSLTDSISVFEEVNVGQGEFRPDKKEDKGNAVQRHDSADFIG